MVRQKSNSSRPGSIQNGVLSKLNKTGSKPLPEASSKEGLEVSDKLVRTTGRNGTLIQTADLEVGPKKLRFQKRNEVSI